jgi:hypothetical protein
MITDIDTMSRVQYNLRIFCTTAKVMFFDLHREKHDLRIYMISSCIYFNVNINGMTVERRPDDMEFRPDEM